MIRPQSISVPYDEKSTNQEFCSYANRLYNYAHVRAALKKGIHGIVNVLPERARQGCRHEREDGNLSPIFKEFSVAHVAKKNPRIKSSVLTTIVFTISSQFHVRVDAEELSIL